MASIPQHVTTLDHYPPGSTRLQVELVGSATSRRSPHRRCSSSTSRYTLLWCSEGHPTIINKSIPSLQNTFSFHMIDIQDLTTSRFP
ncbi:hypothetical protein V6N12_065182 [Hibiscus sabdariffa]|uniref:Uncharacterized protein n=1 Tax=Hibiscus sabdariffa TaxID=183260 RepID=A0ABR2G7Y2_9ROSI